MTSESNAQRDLFLSHRSTDKPFARQLAANIAQHEHRGHRLTVWLDEAEIRPGQSVTALVNWGLEHSRFIALVMTPDYFRSDSGWPDAEWHAALFVDPDNRRGRILPLLAADCPYIPILLRHLLFDDFRGAAYANGFDRLLGVLTGEQLPRLVSHRGQLIRPSTYIDRATLVAERSAVAADPDAVEENLSCNLLPVEKLPTLIYRAPLARLLQRKRRGGTISYPSKEELKDMVRRQQEADGVERPFVPAFRMNGDHIVTFHDLDSPDSVLRPITDADEVDTLPTSQFVLQEDDRRIVVSLMSMGIERHLFSRGLLVDRSRRGPARFFYPPAGGQEQVIEWTPFRKRTTRTVAKPYQRSGTTAYWLHQAAYIKPVFLAARFFLQITPTWLLTEDGTKVKGGSEVGKVIVRWTGRERNTAVLYHVRFWTWVLSNRTGPITIRLGDQMMEVSQLPAYVHEPYGIARDSRDLMLELDKDAGEIALAERVVEVEEADADEVTAEGNTIEEGNERAEEPDGQGPEAAR